MERGKREWALGVNNEVPVQAAHWAEKVGAFFLEQTKVD